MLRPGGLLILGTPDYSTLGWRFIEPLYRAIAPGAYASEHITHYTRAALERLAAERGLRVEHVRWVFRSELILALRRAS